MDFEFTPVDAIDKVPEQFRGIYKQDGDKFVPDEAHKGIVEAITGLNRSLKAARAEAKAKTPVDLTSLSEFGATPEEIKTSITTRLAELQDQLAGKNGEAKVNLDKIRSDLAAAHAKELEKSNKRSEALQGQLYSLLVENAATSAVAELKGVPELLLPFIKNQVKVQEQDGQFQVFVVDAQGDQRYSGVTGQPMTIKELVAEMKANEKYGRLFESEAPAGGGMLPGSGRQTTRTQGQPRSSNEKISAGLNKRFPRA